MYAINKNPPPILGMIALPRIQRPVFCAAIKIAVSDTLIRACVIKSLSKERKKSRKPLLPRLPGLCYLFPLAHNGLILSKSAFLLLFLYPL